MKCSICKGEMITFMDTLLCPICNNIPLTDLIWCKNWMEEHKK